MTTMAINLEKE